MSAEKKHKHLRLEDRQEIQDCLHHGMTFKAIAARIGKDQTTVSKEVRKHVSIVKPSGVTAGHEPALCPKLQKAPFVCNGCLKRTSCRLEKHYYRAQDAQNDYRTTLVESREGIPLTKESFYRADEILFQGVQKGQHIYHIATNHDLGMSVSTVYRNISRGYLSVCKLDLPRAAKFKQRVKHTDYVPSVLKKGRTYADFQEHIAQNGIDSWCEMDTVIGTPGGKVIMTFDFTDSNLMFGLLLENKTALEAAEKITALKKRLSDSGFSFGEVFPLLLTDNGGEFANIHAFTDDSDGNSETNVFFCDPYCSCQKPHVEKNHTLFRDIVPKGYSFDSFTQDDVNLIFSHVNSIARKKLHKKTPIDVFRCYYSHIDVSELLKVLGIQSIDANDVIQSPELLKQLKHLSAPTC